MTSAEHPSGGEAAKPKLKRAPTRWWRRRRTRLAAVAAGTALAPILCADFPEAWRLPCAIAQAVLRLLGG